MRKILFFVACSILITINTQAQNRLEKEKAKDVEADYKNATDLKKTTLMVVVDEDQPELTERLKSSIEQYWKHTKYEYIKPSQVEEYIKKKDYSVLDIFRVIQGKETMSFMYAILLGDTKNKNLNDAKIIASIRLPDKWQKNTGSDLKEFDYLIPFFIQSLNKYVEDDLKKIVDKTYAKGNAIFYNDGFNILKNKKIIVYKEAINEKFKKKSFCKNFSINDEQVTFVNKEDIQKAIDKKDANVAFVFNMESTGVIYDAKTSEPLAYGSGMNLTVSKIISRGTAAVALGGFIYFIVRIQHRNKME
jgi:hypothetical protein